VSVQRGDLFVAYPDERLSARCLIRVTRVAKDGSWADITVSTWAVQWSKRQPLPFKFPHATWADAHFTFEEQEEDHMAMLHEKCVL
jgi:hypothetical protein